MAAGRSGIVVGFVGAGQLGTALMQGLCAAGVPRVLAYSVPADTQAPARVQAAGATFVATPEGLAQADIVFSAVTSQAARQAAADCAPHLAPHAIYVDLNSMGPQQKRTVEQALQPSGRDFVDAAVLGAAADGIRVPIVLAGVRAGDVVAALTPFGMNLRAIGQRCGDAAAIKIVRSVLAKGLETLYVEALVAARRMGVEAEVLDSFCAMLDSRPAASMAQLLVTTHVLHAERRMHELDMSVQVLDELGVPPLMARATRDVLARTAQARVSDTFGGRLPTDLDAALAALDPVMGATAPERRCGE